MISSLLAHITPVEAPTGLLLFVAGLAGWFCGRSGLGIRPKPLKLSSFRQRQVEVG